MRPSWVRPTACEIHQREALDRLLDHDGPPLAGYEVDACRVVELPAHGEARMEPRAGGGGGSSVRSRSSITRLPGLRPHIFVMF